MPGETNITALIKTKRPQLNEGEYVFCTISTSQQVDYNDVIGSFREAEGLTVILNKEVADNLNLTYSYVASWITLAVHSSLEAVGLTAAFSNALAKEGISCNVIAAFYHDHIFVAKADTVKAMAALKQLSKG